MYLVYQAKHLPSGKVYIGRTSKSLQERIGQHWGAIFKKRSKFQHFLHTTKMDEWEWTIIKEFSELESSLDCELYHIHKFNCYINGLNSKPGLKHKSHKEEASRRMKDYKAKNLEPWNKGKKQVYSEETLEKMRLAKLRKPTRRVYTEEQKVEKSKTAKNRKAVAEMSSGQIFPSISAAANHFGLRREAVRDVVNGKRSHTAGLVFVAEECFKDWIKRAYDHNFNKKE